MLKFRLMLALLLPLATATQSYFKIGPLGTDTYSFGYDVNEPREAPRLLREETRLEDGTVIGRYGYSDPTGSFRMYRYHAGPEGYFASEITRENDQKEEIARPAETRFEPNVLSEPEVMEKERQRPSSQLYTDADHLESRPAIPLNYLLNKQPLKYASFEPIIDESVKETIGGVEDETELKLGDDQLS
ncbi:uncharacterized protein LOC143230562 [Tachypleus tridentatus]|uniref:uncharacterized protein LOC143230276 n=1 Tax=Tachypleus tridentatus TaxID=6853 RepID=UPI003FD40174